MKNLAKLIDMFKPIEPVRLKDIKLELQCENCGVPTNILNESEGLFNCNDCTEAIERRAQLKQAEEEWNE